MKEQILVHGQSLALFLTIIVVTIVVGALFKRLFNRFIKQSSIVIHNDPTNYKFIGHLISAIIYIVGFSWAIYEVTALRSIASSLLAGAGILAVAVGFAAQHALSNVISGLFIILFKPFRINDRLTLRTNISGVVEDVTLRHTVLRDLANKRIIIPNAVISDEIIVNADFVDDKSCRFLEFNISFDTDIDQARRIIQDEVAKNPLYIDKRTEQDKIDGVPSVTVRVINIGEYAITLRAWLWTKGPSDSFLLHCELLEAIKKQFDKEHISLPYPHRNIIHTNEN